MAIPALIGFLAGFVGGLLGTGGSLLIIPALVLYLSYTRGYTGSDQHLLQAAAMICNVFVAAPSVLVHWRAKAIVPRVVIVLVPVAIGGILLGVTASNSSFFARQNGVYLLMALAGFMVYVAVYNGLRLVYPLDLEKRFDSQARVSPFGAGAVGLVMGFSAGLLGVGGGALCVPLQQVILRIPLRRAIANSATTIVCVSALGALYKNLTLSEHGISPLNSVHLAALLVPGAMLGSYIGGRLTHALPRKALRVAFIAFMLVTAGLMFSKAHRTRKAPRGNRPAACFPREKCDGVFAARHAG